MRLFQNCGYYPSYGARYRQVAGGAADYAGWIDAFVADRYGASHILSPIQERREWAFLANGEDDHVQQLWAREQGMKTAALDEILLAQIEAHRADIFYTLDPVRFDSSFVRRLPGCVKRTIAWRTAPAPQADFSAYDLVVSNFPSMLRTFEKQGCRTAIFFPAHDPVMDEFARRTERPVDVIFVGGYSRQHIRRARLLEAMVSLADRRSVALHLDLSRLTRLAETPIGLVPPLRRLRRPRIIRKLTRPPIFGIELYQALSQAKIAFNGSGDPTGEERANMRCFESMGCGALLVSDDGIYPKGMSPGETLLTYSDEADLVTVIERALENGEERRRMARAGHEAISSLYSKDAQWKRFQELSR